MSMNITIRDKIYEKLKSEKGNGSFSDVIESYMNKHDPAHPSAKTDAQAASTPARSTDNDGILTNL